MAEVLVVSMPFAGHVGPMSAVAAEMVRRDHVVTAYTGAKYRERFTSVGATWLPWTKATDYDDADVAATFPQVGDGKGVRGGRANIDHVLFGTAPGQVADIMAAGPFDVVVTDQLAFGGAVAGQALGLAWATVAVTPLSLTSEELPPVGAPWTPATGPAGRMRDAAARALIRAVCRRTFDPKINRLRAEVGLGPVPPGRLFDSMYSPHLILAQGVPGLEYPRADLPGHVHFVGRLAPPIRAGAAAGLPDWWPDLAAARTVTYVTQGTLDVDPDDLLKPAVAALAGGDTSGAQGMVIVCTTGGADPAVLGPLPSNVRAAALLPHDLLLPEVDVIVTNGGWGGVLAALEAGIPLVVAGASLDKPEVARRVAWSGAGLDLRTGTPKPDRIAQAVRDVTTQPGFRTRARELGAALTAAGGVTTAADLLEDLLVR